ncbi:carbamoyltransferase N-terminal domain-containing protein [Granulicella sp. L60]|uniref:carbamoyltransferase family protein n=1 Tax=Granulicella sp. L60 TaxID=1641866 RepID=UPI00131C527F|nr:carbamoyltransferase N-terminal domain-containing protein [Granulicella sp. L60]
MNDSQRRDVHYKPLSPPPARLKKSKTLNIIGISAGYHDAACCLIRDGVLISAAQEERFSRVKNDKSLPRRALRYCLEDGAIAIGDIDCIAYYENPTLKLGRQIWMGMQPNISDRRIDMIAGRMMSPTPQATIRSSFGYDGPIEIFEHHASHAASSFYLSGFEEAAILTVDGVGDWATTTYGFGKNAQIERFEQVDFPHSLGFFYSAITAYLGFEVNEGEYKVMGLAPYGKPLYANKLRSLIDVWPEGQYRLNMDYFAFLTQETMFSEKLCELMDHPARVPESQLDQFHMDVAKSAQLVLEQVLLEKVSYLHSRVPSENLCMAGGVALNVVANSRCLREGPFKRLFVQPAAGDAGGAVGAAAMAYVQIAGKRLEKNPLQHVYLGPRNLPSDIERLLNASNAAFLNFSGKESELIQYAIDRVQEGKVIAWSQGRMEFGPRSLGARSILADPRDPEMRDRINALVKMREAFRPFAPVVLESQAHKHFDLDHPSPFMLETCTVISDLALPAITHVDGSARVQTVNHSTNRRLSLLLEEFDRRTGCPILLNTSLNMRGDPIACTLYDVLMCFVQSQIDILVVEDFVIERAGIPTLWSLEALKYQAAKAKPGESISHSIYTLL